MTGYAEAGTVVARAVDYTLPIMLGVGVAALCAMTLTSRK